MITYLKASLSHDVHLKRAFSRSVVIDDATGVGNGEISPLIPSHNRFSNSLKFDGGKCYKGDGGGDLEEDLTLFSFITLLCFAFSSCFSLLFTTLM